MKTLLVTLIALVSVSAHSEVKRPGTFVPSLCSYQNEGGRIRPSIVAVKEACIGKIAGFEKDALEVQLTDGSRRVYQIQMRRSGPPRMGQNRTAFEGALANTREHDEVRGQLVFTTGITTSWTLQFRTDTNLTFSGNLREVFVTQ